MSQSPGRSDYTPTEKDGYAGIPSRDPYRVVTTKGDAPEMAQGNNPMHMRTGSQTSAAQMNMPPYDPYDPYGVPAREPTTPTGQQHAFLPYGNQQIDPFATSASAGSETGYLVDDKEGGRSLIENNHNNMIAMDMMHDDYNNTRLGSSKGINDQLSASEILVARKRGCLSRLRSRGMVFVAFVLVILVGLAWFFVWPRWPNSIMFQNLGILTPYNATDPNSKIYEAVWQLNLTIDNSDNWIPTRIKGFSVKVTDGSTHVKIGEGHTGSVVLPGKARDILISLPLAIQYSSDNRGHPTLASLFYCASIASSSSSTSTTTTQGLNLIFYIREEISGIVWTETATVHPSIVGCPT